MPDMNGAPSSFAVALRTLLDAPKVLSRSEWARLLGVSESAISQWVNDETFPKPENLRTIIDTLMHDSRVHDDVLVEFEKVAKRPLDEISPHGRRIGSSIEGYVLQPLRERFIGALAVLPARFQEIVLRESAERCWRLRETRPAEPTLSERRHGGFRSLVAQALHEAAIPAKTSEGGQLEKSKKRDATVVSDLVAAMRTRYDDLEGAYLQDVLAAGILTEGRQRKRQEVDVAAVVDQAVEAVQAAVERKGLEVHKSIGSRIRKIAGDPEGLHHAFGSLVFNAASVARPGERIDVRVMSERGSVIVEISDKGSGYPPSERGRFAGRLGWGLLLTSRVIRLSGGMLSTGSGEDETVFRVTFPSRRKTAESTSK